MGKWERPEGILILEARSLLKSLKRIALTSHNMRQLLLSDNMSVVLASARSRSRD
jgi:hypothetical protein